MESENSSVESAPKKTSLGDRPIDSPVRPYWHLIGVAAFYCFVLFCCTLGVESGYAAIPLLAGVSSTVVLVAVWSVFGSGSYLKRLVCSHAVGAIPAAGIFLGMLIHVAGDSWAMVDEFIYGALIGLISTVTISVGAQIPFWFFRGLFGWQFVLRNRNPEPAFSLRDIFALTFVFACCFAVPQLAINLQTRMEEDQRAEYSEYEGADSMTVTEAVVQTNGEVVFEERDMTDADREQARRDQMSVLRLRMFSMFGASTLFVLVGSLLSLPIVLFIFRPAANSTRCGLTIAYAFGVWLVLVGVGAILSGGAAGTEFALYVGGAIALWAAGISIPLLISRETGFRLTSPKRFEIEQNRSNLAVQNGRQTAEDEPDPRSEN